MIKYLTVAIISSVIICSGCAAGSTCSPDPTPSKKSCSAHSSCKGCPHCSKSSTESKNPTSSIERY